MGESFWFRHSHLLQGAAKIMATKTLMPPAAAAVLPVLPPQQEPSIRIGPEVIRNALYGKWCNVLGHSLTRETKAASPELVEQNKGK